MSDKAYACELLLEYVKTLKDVFMPFVERTAQVMVPNLSFNLHQSIAIKLSNQ